MRRLELARQRGRERRTRAGRTNIRSIRFLRWLAVAEATAFVVLIVCAVTKPHLFGIDLLFVMGNLHGAVFTAYLVAIVVFRNKVGWGPFMLFMVLVAGLVPGGGIMVERWALHPPGPRVADRRRSGPGGVPVGGWGASRARRP